MAKKSAVIIRTSVSDESEVGNVAETLAAWKSRRRISENSDKVQENTPAVVVESQSVGKLPRSTEKTLDNENAGERNSHSTTHASFQRINNLESSKNDKVPESNSRSSRIEIPMEKPEKVEAEHFGTKQTSFISEPLRNKDSFTQEKNELPISAKIELQKKPDLSKEISTDLDSDVFENERINETFYKSNNSPSNEEIVEVNQEESQQNGDISPVNNSNSLAVEEVDAFDAGNSFDNVSEAR